MKLSYLVRGGEVVYFTCGQELAKGIFQAIKHPCSGMNSNAYLPLKYQDRVVGYGVQIMQYLVKTLLMKKAKVILEQYGTDGYAALQLLHLQFYPIHFLFQTD